jgi:hypothetical protein
MTIQAKKKIDHQYLSSTKIYIFVQLTVSRRHIPSIFAKIGIFF